MVRRLMVVLGMLSAVCWTSMAVAHVELEATLDTAQEVPTPHGTLAGAGGTATFMFDEATLKLDYTTSVQSLTAAPVAGHVHKGAPGVQGGIEVGLPALPAAASGSVSGSVNLPQSDVDALYSSGLYINFHTPTNGGGEIRGQIRLKTPGACSCTDAASPAAFKKCIRGAIRKLDKTERKEKAVKDILKAAKRSSCGKRKGPRKAVACCLPQTPDDNIVTAKLCAQVPEKACAGITLGGRTATSLGTGSSCFPTNPCRLASPSGAFLD